ncbi:MAG: hypothetical protein JOY82_14210 [Streptosporangiaceae bacterium]|nr:hypothetical protein [Streptosporangiaceae bacterium]MBV9855642.1 hypothetical protein [Streptosporangiaceae bacterium]
MAGVINDIEALEDFRAHLIQFNTELAESFAAIRGHWRELGDVWRDDMYQLFGEALEEVTPGIELYLSATEGHEAHLAALIEQLRGYLETGYGISRRDQRPGRAAGRRGGAPPNDGSPGRDGARPRSGAT